MKSTLFPHKERREGEAAKKCCRPHAKIISHLEAYSVFSCSFTLHAKPIHSPLGKAKEKVRTTQLAQTDAIPVSNGLLCLLFVLFAFSGLHELAEECTLCYGASTSISVMMGGIL